METQPHVVIFPFMSKGHTIPLLHLTRLLLRHRSLAVTLFTTPANRPFISASLSDVDVSIISLPFPSTAPGIPPGVESTDTLPSMSLFSAFATSTKLLQPAFEAALKTLPNLKLIISDGFLHWTLRSANKLNIPRLVSYGMSCYPVVLTRTSATKKLFVGPEPDDEPIAIPGFPWIKLTRNELPHPLNTREPSGPYFDFMMEAMKATSSSNGLLVNSFYELEPLFVDHLNAHVAPRAWPIGPLCLGEPEKEMFRSSWVQWMDRKLEQGTRVLYIAFGTQAEVSSEQLKEITLGLERSEASFLWVMRPSLEQDRIVEGLGERGLVVKEWVDQRAILRHEAIHGFLSHCGWNSVIESMCSSKPILAWPMMADQYLNARMVVEEIKTGIRVETCDGSMSGFVKAEGLEKAVRELMEGEMGKRAREKAKEVGEAARKAMDVGGSSWLALESLLDDFHIGNSFKVTTTTM